MKERKRVEGGPGGERMEREVYRSQMLKRNKCRTKASANKLPTLADTFFLQLREDRRTSRKQKSKLEII